MANSKKKKEISGKVTKNRVVKIFEALGFKTAERWDIHRLQKKLVELEMLVEGAKLDDKTQKRVNEILSLQKKGRKVIVFDPDDADADKKRGQDVEAAQKRATTKKVEKKEKTKRETDKAAGKKPKQKEPKKIGVIASILEFISAGNPVSKKQLLDKLTKRFPDRPVDGMEKTIAAQLPNRMAKEKGIKIKVDDKGRFSTTKK